MAKNYCTFIPSKGAELFNRLKREFGYDLAKSVFLKAINPNFISDFKGSLSLDAEGVPTYDSLLSNSYMRTFIGDEQLMKAIGNEFPEIEDTRENFRTLLNGAYTFNTTNPNSDKFVATVENVSEDKIKIVLHPRTEESVNAFNDMYSSIQLNDTLAEVFKPLGITVDQLTDAEVKAGRVGHVNFRLASEAAKGTASMIRIANNMEGEVALSEEYCHMLVGMFRNEPLVNRTIALLTANEEALVNILGEEYSDVVAYYTDENGNVDREAVAEEAVGHLLRDNLLRETTIQSTSYPSLFRRLINWIKNLFTRLNGSPLETAILDANSFMSELSKDIIRGAKKPTRELLEESQRDKDFNRMASAIARDINILQEYAAKTEAKRIKISSSESIKEKSELVLEDLFRYIDGEGDPVEGILIYSSNALQELRVLKMQMSELDPERYTPRQIFAFLTRCRNYVLSYGKFLDKVHDAMNEDDTSGEPNEFRIERDTPEGRTSVAKIVAELDTLSKSIMADYTSIAFPMFAEFLKPFLGEEVVIPFGAHKGETIAVETLLKEASSDISFMDRWLDSMADSSDVLLQLFARASAKAKHEARMRSIKLIRRVQALRQKAERLGITNFDWAFAKDSRGRKTGYYISRVDYSRFQEELNAMEQSLIDRYGEEPEGEALDNKLAERDAWLNSHAIMVNGQPRPIPDMYVNPDYLTLSDNQKIILSEFLDLKEEMDASYPDNKVSRLKAVQCRKSSGERLFESITSPDKLFENIKQAVANTFLERVDDDAIFGGSRTTRAMMGFDGKEFFTQPALYTTMLENPDDLSTDIFGSLMAYAYATSTYASMDKIIDALEVGTVLVDQRDVLETSGDKKLLERFEAAGIDVVNKITKGNSNISAKLHDWLKSQVYMRYLEPGSSLEIADKHNISTNKVTSFVLKAGSIASLGLNWLANIANVATGLCMQNIEAAASQFFGAKELAMADGAYMANIPAFLAELGSRVKTNKLSLVFELLDIKQDYGKRVKDSVQKKNWFQRIFGEHLAFLGQDAGDHWLYGRTAIAMMLREQVLLNGEKMSLWDALRTKTSTEYGSTITSLNEDEITDLNGNPFNFFDFKERVKKINQRCFGIYNEEDSNAANRVALGRLLQQYRKWMKVQFNTRFQAGVYDVTTKTYIEGYYRTVGRILWDIITGKGRYVRALSEMSDDEKRNFKRALMELVQFFAVWALCNFYDWGADKKDRPWVLKLANYSAERLRHELGGLTPTLTMPKELLKTLKSPIPAINVVDNLFNFVSSCVDPRDWVDEIKSGPYKGMSTLEKNTIKAPLPIFPQVRQVSKFTKDLDTSIQYYMRPY